jgi:hypothetical protein
MLVKVLNYCFLYYFLFKLQFQVLPVFSPPAPYLASPKLLREGEEGGSDSFQDKPPFRGGGGQKALPLVKLLLNSVNVHILKRRISGIKLL